MTAPSSSDPARSVHEQLESASPDLLRELLSVHPEGCHPGQAAWISTP